MRKFTRSSTTRPLERFKRATKVFLFAAATLGMMTFGVAGANAQSAESVYGLTDGGELVAFDPVNPAQVNATVAIGGDASGDTILGIDFRPANGQLYAIGSSSTVYTIDPASGAATTVGVTDPVLEGSVIGFDFNPTADAIRVVTDAGQNLRLTDLDAEMGTTVDGTLAYDDADASAGTQPAVVGAGYTNNVADATETMLYDFDLATGNLVQQDANPGVLTTVGSPGIPFTGNLGFDISPDGAAYAAIQQADGQASSLYAVDLASGTVTEIGVVGPGLILSGFAIPTDSSMSVVPDTGGPSMVATAGVALALAGVAAFLVLGIRHRTSS